MYALHVGFRCRKSTAIGDGGSLGKADDFFFLLRDTGLLVGAGGTGRACLSSLAVARCIIVFTLSLRVIWVEGLRLPWELGDKSGPVYFAIAVYNLFFIVGHSG